MINQREKRKILHWMRRSIQILSVLFFPAMFTTIFYAIKSVYRSLINGTFGWNSFGMPLLIVGGVFIATLIFGRIFCGFLCSFGAMEDLLWFLSQNTLKVKWRIPKEWDTRLKWIKHILFFLILIGFWTIQYEIADRMASPWTVFGIYTSVDGWSSPKYLISLGGFLLLLIMAASLFIERFFCRYLCPLGAAFVWFGKFRPYVLKKPKINCGKCQICTHYCSMGIPLNEMDHVQTGECIECFQCMEKCPKDNISTNPGPIAVSTLSAAAIFGLVYIGTLPIEGASLSGGQKSVSQAKEENVSPQTEEESAGKYIDGTYTGTAMGFRGNTEVSAVVENGQIKDITVVSFGDDAQFFRQAESAVIEEILDAQSTEVSVVTGATFSSNGIIDAVADALKTAFADGYEGETETRKTEEQKTEEDTSKSSEKDTEKTYADGNYTDGVYTGTGTGFRGDTEVSVTVEGGQITDITVVSYQDDDAFFNQANSSVISEILDTQNIDVATVSGATFSSNGIKEAVANALGISFTNPNADSGNRGHGHGHKRREQDNYDYEDDDFHKENYNDYEDDDFHKKNHDDYEDDDFHKKNHDDYDGYEKKRHEYDEI